LPPRGLGEKRQENKSLRMRLFRNAAVALSFAAAGWGDRSVALALPRESEAGSIPSGEARDLTCRNEVGVLLPGPTLQSFSGVANPSACCALCSTTKVCHYTTQPLAEMYGGCIVVLKVSWCAPRRRAAPLGRSPGCRALVRTTSKLAQKLGQLQPSTAVFHP
jgi:hypothetical protein